MGVHKTVIVKELPSWTVAFPSSHGCTRPSSYPRVHVVTQQDRHRGKSARDHHRGRAAFLDCGFPITPREHETNIPFTSARHRTREWECTRPSSWGSCRSWTVALTLEPNSHHSTNLERYFRLLGCVRALMLTNIRTHATTHTHTSDPYLERIINCTHLRGAPCQREAPLQ